MATNRMYTPDFSGSIAKLHRAMLYCDDLDHGIANYFSANEHKSRVRSDLEESSGEHVFSVADIPDIRPFQIELSVVIGDVCHNLRSALDHAVFQLALHNTNDNLANERTIQFPIESDANSFQKAAASRLKEVTAEHQAVIEKLQPYHPLTTPIHQGRRHPLDLLADLSNTDKHRLLNTVLSVPRSFDFTIPGMSGEIGLPTVVGSTLFLGQELVSLHSPGDPPIPDHIDTIGHLTPVLMLAGEKDQVVWSLRRIGAFVKEALDELQKSD